MSEHEQIVDVGRGVTICCERLGSREDSPLLLIAGLGQQLLSWPDDFCAAIVARGYQVIRFDNRDSGRSWHAPVPPPRRGQLLTRRFSPGQYDLADMAQDSANLIEALGVAPAHVVGISMGGMIAQTLGARHRACARSLVSIMSTTGALRAGWIAPSTVRLMLKKPAATREIAADRAEAMFRHVGSRGFPFEAETVRDVAIRTFDRDPQAAAGTARQIAAILKSGDRTAELHRISAPTLVIHGDRDPMVHPSGGRATARAIPGARAETIRGMGHDLPMGAWERLVELITGHAAQVVAAPGGAAAKVA